MYRLLTFLYPKKIRKKITDLLIYSNLKVDSRKFLGFILVSNFCISLILGFFLGSMYSVNFLFISIPVFIAMYISMYLWLIVYADKKAKFIEEMLPDALQLMATNLRSGFTTDRAFLLSARPEFGPLKDEINIVGKEITAGKPIDVALKGISDRVKSKKLERAINLVISGLRSGGRLADLLQQTADELKDQAIVDKKVRTSVNMYVIFIFIAVAFGAPLLLSLSSFLVEVLSNTLANVQIPMTVSQSFSIPMGIKSISISPEFVLRYAIVTLLTTSIFGSFIIGLIKSGREKDGIKLLLPLIIMSIAIFFVIRFLVANLTGGLLLG